MTNNSSSTRQIFVVSDGTGITAQHLAQSLMSQFENIEFTTTTLPYIDTKEKAIETVNKINHACQTNQSQPIVFATLVKSEISELINASGAKIYDLFNTFLAPLEETLSTKSSYTTGRSHGLKDAYAYQKRISALNFSLDHDDGVKLKGYKNADLIIIGVSRCGKTPTAIYLAMQFGLKVANYPLTEDDASFSELPDCLLPYKHKMFGITISCDRLHSVRNERKPNSIYASLTQCKKEVSNVERMFNNNNIPYINSTSHSIEEMSTRIIARFGIERKIY